mgnify:CR=1 FL=1
MRIWNNFYDLIKWELFLFYLNGGQKATAWTGAHHDDIIWEQKQAIDYYLFKDQFDSFGEGLPGYNLSHIISAPLFPAHHLFCSCPCSSIIAPSYPIHLRLLRLLLFSLIYREKACRWTPPGFGIKIWLVCPEEGWRAKSFWERRTQQQRIIFVRLFAFSRYSCFLICGATEKSWKKLWSGTPTLTFSPRYLLKYHSSSANQIQYEWFSLYPTKGGKQVLLSMRVE